MITMQNDVELLPYNTFRIKAKARHLVTVRSVAEVQELISQELFKNSKYLILGGGSNLLLTKDYDGLVIKNEIKGITVQEKKAESVLLKVGGGENWHDLVMYAVEHNLGGIENLSLIPGTAGAAPMQNIGAYGVEIKEVIHNVEAIELSSGAIHNFSRVECKFGYRESVFKQHLKDRYLISSITLSLTTDDHHKFNVSYGAITDVLKQNGVEELSVKKISDAVIQIRRSKLPDPNVIGNAGSFFKNPSIEPSLFEALEKKFPAIPSFPGENGLIKIPAAWLIEQCGWKGKTLENIGVHKNQALVLVNYGDGEGKKIWELAMSIQRSVQEKFNINLHPEVNVI
jgi:UDP-N-acetylmuramate dehydrogenase